MKPGAPRSPSGLVVADGDLVVEQVPHRLEELEHLLEVALVVLHADVLHHADRADAVEIALGHVAIVHHAQFGQILEAFTLDPLLAVFDLLLGQGDAERLDAALGGLDDERAPAAADVEQALARLEVELVEHQADLVELRVLQAHVLVVEHRAGVGHRGAEEVAVELVRQIVVEAHRLGVGLLGVRQQAGLDAGELGGAFRMPWLSTAEPTFATESGDRLFTYGASDSSWRSWGYGSA